MIFNHNFRQKKTFPKHRLKNLDIDADDRFTANFLPIVNLTPILAFLKLGFRAQAMSSSHETFQKN
jgi:hypothetical protein